jgi:hypothetical protein
MPPAPQTEEEEEEEESCIVTVYGYVHATCYTISFPPIALLRKYAELYLHFPTGLLGVQRKIFSFLKSFRP